MRAVTIGSRPSLLALRQVAEIKACFAGIKFHVVPIATQGDFDKKTALERQENTDFFTREVERALLAGVVDAAVHSAKDLEEDVPEGLVIAALTKSISPYDCLVSRGGWRLEDIPSGSVIGTSSRNRKQTILSHRPDLVVKDIRGNVDNRLLQLDQGLFDAIIVAHAALIRLGELDRPFEILSEDVLAPHPLQGRLAVQVRKGNRELYRLFRKIHEK